MTLIESLPLSKRVDIAIARTDAWSLPIVSQIERVHPGARFGKQKMEHMQGMSADAVAMGHELGLSDDDSQLLRVINRTHDLGRHLEELYKMNTTRKGVRHGVLSQEVLTDELNFSGLFTEQELETITFAVYWHPEMDLPDPDRLTPAQNKGHELSYVLRDMDKEELLHNVDGVLSPNETYRQLRMHNTLLREQIREQDPLHLLLITNLLEGKNPTGKADDAVSQEIIRVLQAAPANADIHDVVSRFTNLMQIPIQTISENYSNYMLLQLATVFDIKNTVILRRLWENRESWLTPRMKFLEARTEHETFRFVTQTIYSYFRNKLEAGNLKFNQFT